MLLLSCPILSHLKLQERIRRRIGSVRTVIRDICHLLLLATCMAVASVRRRADQYILAHARFLFDRMQVTRRLLDVPDARVEGKPIWRVELNGAFHQTLKAE